MDRFVHIGMSESHNSEADLEANHQTCCPSDAPCYETCCLSYPANINCQTCHQANMALVSAIMNELRCWRGERTAPMAHRISDCGKVSFCPEGLVVPLLDYAFRRSESLTQARQNLRHYLHCRQINCGQCGQLAYQGAGHCRQTILTPHINTDSRVLLTIEKLQEWDELYGDVNIGAYVSNIVNDRSFDIELKSSNHCGETLIVDPLHLCAVQWLIIKHGT